MCYLVNKKMILISNRWIRPKVVRFDVTDIGGCSIKWGNYMYWGPCNSQIFKEMKIRELQKREFQGPPYWGLVVP